MADANNYYFVKFEFLPAVTIEVSLLGCGRYLPTLQMNMPSTSSRLKNLSLLLLIHMRLH
jgi:hypothetical protein